MSDSMRQSSASSSLSSAFPAMLAEQARSGPPELADALSIWWAGVEATLPETIFRRETRIEGHELHFADYSVPLHGIRRIVVVGAGKASGAMASALYRTCLQSLAGRVQVEGWINAPAGSYLPASAGPIHLHTARPAGRNEPTPEAEFGTRKIIDLVSSCTPDDLCLVLLSGGGSAILTAPIADITLSDKQQVARQLAAAGANIQQLNTVRRSLSRVKGGGLARVCRARQMVTLVLSDVLGDPLETIASGPTVIEAAATPQMGLDVLRELDLIRHPDLANVVQTLNRLSGQAARGNVTRPSQPSSQPLTHVEHIVLANNATAVDAAGVKAVELGYRYIMQASRSLEGDVQELAVRVADTVEQLGHQSQIDCWISGGEPTVRLPSNSPPGMGGRNQQLMLLTMLELASRGWPQDAQRFPTPLLCLSAGTDGEDGPTPAAGAWFDADVWKRLQLMGVDARDYANRADAFHLFEQTGSLILCEPTGTNVCDLRVAVKRSSVT